MFHANRFVVLPLDKEPGYALVRLELFLDVEKLQLVLTIIHLIT